MVLELRQRQCPSKSERAITKDSGGKDERIIVFLIIHPGKSQSRECYQNGIAEVSDGPSKDHFIGKFGSKGGRKGGCLEFGHYAKECPNGRDTSLDEDNNHSRDIFNDQRNDW